MKKELTIAILSLNRKEYLYETLESIFLQTLIPDNIIVYDNGSAPDVKKHINMYIGRGVKWYGANKTYSPHWNWRRAVNGVTTNYISIIHDDDRLCKEYVEKQLEYLNSYPEIGAVSCNGFVIDESGKRNGQLVRPNFIGFPAEIYSSRIEVAKIYASDLCIPISPVTYRAQFVKKIKESVHDEIYLQYGKVSDAVFMTELAEIGKIAYQALALYECRYHTGQDSNLFNEESLQKLEDYFWNLEIENIKQKKELIKLLTKQHTSRVIVKKIKELKKFNIINNRKFSIAACFNIIINSIWKKISRFLGFQ